MEEERENKEKKKFVLDYRSDPEGREKIAKLVAKVKERPHGDKITLKHIVDYALAKLAPKDLEKVWEASLTSMDRVLLELERHNQKNQTNLELGDFLAERLKLN
ncbi:MAG: hypothetical protein OXB88_10820 [Bacteriovoracales bacterium]|nr:hypothetical protein [Bacteriovoracales bacterium]